MECSRDDAGSATEGLGPESLFNVCTRCLELYRCVATVPPIFDEYLGCGSVPVAIEASNGSKVTCGRISP